jgi:hypothetical protein
MKIHMRILAVILLVLLSIIGLGCESDAVPIEGGNPPRIGFWTGALQLYVMGPYTLEQLKQGYKIAEGKTSITTEEAKQGERIRGKKTCIMWQLDPGTGFRRSEPYITYGRVPDGFRQVYPANGEPPEPLIEGKIYAVIAPSYDTDNIKRAYFMIDKGKAVVVPPNKITDK